MCPTVAAPKVPALALVLNSQVIRPPPPVVTILLFSQFPPHVVLFTDTGICCRHYIIIKHISCSFPWCCISVYPGQRFSSFCCRNTLYTWKVIRNTKNIVFVWAIFIYSYCFKLKIDIIWAWAYSSEVRHLMPTMHKVLGSFFGTAIKYNKNAHTP